MLKIAIRKMTEMYNSALVCNLSNLSSIEHPEQQNSRKKKKILLQCYPQVLHSQEEGVFEHSFKISAIKFYDVSISFCSCYVWAEKQHSIIMSARQFSGKKLCEEARLFQWVKQNNYS